MKYNLLGAVSTIALGAAFGIGTHGAANAALTCTSGSGNTVGSFTCSESVSAGFAITPTTNVLSLDKWVSNASATFTQTLKSVEFTVSESLAGHGYIVNQETVSVTGSFFAGVTLGAQNGANAPSNFISPNISTHIAAIGPVVTLTAGASDPYSYTTSISSGLKTVSGSLTGFVSVSPASFSALVTAVLGSGAFAANPEGNNINGVTTSAAPTIQLTYNFTTSQPPPPPSPTPEPASLALLGVGLAGLGAVRRRRKS
jgi:hypothetical protein